MWIFARAISTEQPCHVGVNSRNWRRIGPADALRGHPNLDVVRIERKSALGGTVECDEGEAGREVRRAPPPGCRYLIPKVFPAVKEGNEGCREHMI